MLILNDLAPMHWALAGALIGGLVLLMLAVVNRRLGMSTGFESLCALVVRTPYFEREKLQRSAGWRLPIVAGLVLGGMLSAALSGCSSAAALASVETFASSFAPGVLTARAPVKPSSDTISSACRGSASSSTPTPSTYRITRLRERTTLSSLASGPRVPCSLSV